MDVDRELARVNARVQRNIDRAYYEALGRLYDIPWEVARTRDQVGKLTKQLEPVTTQMGLVGMYYGNLFKAFQTLAEQFAKGWNRTAQ